METSPEGLYATIRDLRKETAGIIAFYGIGENSDLALSRFDNALYRAVTAVEHNDGALFYVKPFEARPVKSLHHDYNEAIQKTASYKSIQALLEEKADETDEKDEAAAGRALATFENKFYRLLESLEN